MKNVILFFTLAISSSLVAQSTWKVDKAHSKISFDITHLMISEVTGNFDDFDITATADDSFSDASFEVVIQATSVDTDNERRDNHLRSADFFEVETYPTLVFKSNSFEKVDDKNFKLNGDLTIHGITLPITLDGKVNGIITDQRSQKLKAGLKVTGTIDRLAYKVGGETATLGDEVAITINMELAQQ